MADGNERCLARLTEIVDAEHGERFSAGRNIFSGIDRPHTTRLLSLHSVEAIVTRFGIEG